MKPSPKAVSVSTTSLAHMFKILFGIGLTALLLMFTFAPSAGQMKAGIDERSARTIEPADLDQAATTASDNKEVESVTMSISVEEGGSIDLKPPPPGMTIETWKGKDVLLIVEKVNQKGKKSRPGCAVEPIDIQVTREGKDVRIETMCGAGWENSGMDVSFRLMIPENRDIMRGLEPKHFTLSELTTKVWKALNKEALIRLFL